MLSLVAKSSLFVKFYLKQVVVAAELEVIPPTSHDGLAPVDHARGMLYSGSCLQLVPQVNPRGRTGLYFSISTQMLVHYLYLNKGC